MRSRFTQQELERFRFPVCEEDAVLRKDHYSWFLTHNGADEVQLLNVDTNVKFYMIIVVDGREMEPIIVDLGVSNIPVYFSYGKNFTILLQLHESWATDEEPDADVRINVISTKAQ